MNAPRVETFFDEATGTATHVASCPQTKRCAVIDSVLDYDPCSGRISTKSADAVADYVAREGLDVEWVLETHIHADHLSAGLELKNRLGGKLAIGASVVPVQKRFAELFDAGPEFRPDGSQFDHLFADGERFKLGAIDAVAIATPGHTPACMTYVIGDAAFVGDTVFMPDFGTARCDFPGGDARALHRSIQRLFALPPETRVFVGHDYKAPERDRFAWQTTVAEQSANNVHVGAGKSEDAFVRMRVERDASLSTPRLMLPAVQVNMRGGALPPAAPNGLSYLKIPVDAL